MSYSGDAAEQIVRMSLNGIEIAARISGKAAERLAVLIYAVLKDQKKTRGKTRLASLLRSGKELKVFAVKDKELSRFCDEAKKYGVLYCVLKDNKAEDGLTDIMVRAEDASKINRIFERFNLATIDLGSVKAEIERSRDAAEKTGDAMADPERDAVRDKVEAFLDKVVPEDSVEEEEKTNPSSAPSRQSGQSGNSYNRQKEELTRDRNGASARPSVRKELEDIRKQMAEKPDAGKRKERDVVQKHIPPAKKKARKKEVSL